MYHEIRQKKLGGGGGGGGVNSLGRNGETDSVPTTPFLGVPHLLKGEKSGCFEIGFCQLADYSSHPSRGAGDMLY